MIRFLCTSLLEPISPFEILLIHKSESRASGLPKIWLPAHVGLADSPSLTRQQAQIAVRTAGTIPDISELHFCDFFLVHRKAAGHLQITRLRIIPISTAMAPENWSLDSEFLPKHTQPFPPSKALPNSPRGSWARTIKSVA